MPAHASLEQISSLVFAEHVTKLLYRVEEQATAGVTTAQLVALTWVNDNPGCTIKHLAQGIRVNHSAACQIVHKLSGDGRVRLQPGEDRREARLHIQPAGQRVLAAARERRLASLGRILGKMEPGERRALVEGLTAFLRQALSSEDKVDDACGRCWVEHFGECVVNVLHRDLTGRETKRIPAAS